ncbi:D-alanine-D-alanine ligase [Rhizobium sp. SG_E_25_P2]|uniref:D-alanine--D-alanine ligase family protein n=1 Tax=Rhizobium sp. SG_E_25_P2 TaxID=2879942 RepID=UPI0024734EC9|nr:D-alanine--D-alanine ligase family protein [Rhizobium sp. SG_E_25_P2]MDH6269894.1 D-alanine-D-alanine ligase [Rhizobium sp. SG_E_25_P2]
MTDKQGGLRIGVLYGGRSSEHDVSLRSGTNVVRALMRSGYEPAPIFVARDGRFRLGEDLGGETLTAPESGAELCLPPGGRGRLVALGAEGARELPALDALFPVLHGLHGEDGSMQGLADIACLPLVGCGLLGSAAAIDKAVAKRLLSESGLPVARDMTLRRGEPVDFGAVTAALGAPVFVKPARQGSSVGVGKAANAAEFDAALAEAFRHDEIVLVEEFVAGREIEFSVLETEKGDVIVSSPGEIAPAASHGFYTYDAKYLDPDGAALIAPARLPDDVEDVMRHTARAAFRSLGCDGMARVDFFLRANGSFVINEVNTMPGFTDISMYARAFAASGLAYDDLVDRLVRHGLARFRR